jgi:hypothetical protein
MAKNEVQVASNNAMAVLSDQVPDFLKGKQSSRGSENVGTEDLIIPRLELVQDLSPCRKKTDPSYIEGIQEGMLYNNVTRQNYGTDVLVVPVYFRKEWLIWKDRTEGGGFRGAYGSEMEARSAMATLEDGEKCEVLDTAQHFCLLVHPETGKVEEIVLSMSKSKMKVSRKWNSLIRMNEGDSFSRVYRISAVSEKNNKNQDYFNLAVATAGFPNLEVYQRAEKLYEAITSGAVQIDRKVDAEAVEEMAEEY